MLSGVLFVTNQMMNHGDSRVKPLRQSLHCCCKKSRKIGHYLRKPSVCARQIKLASRSRV